MDIELIVSKDIFMSGVQGRFSEYPVNLILPQIPLTIGNACVGTADTSTSLFTGNSQLKKAKAGKFDFSMGIMNLPEK